MEKVAIYTCITGGYDTLKQPSCSAPEFDFICYTDRLVKEGERDGVWTLRRIEGAPATAISDSSLLSRWVKWQPHLLLPEYSYSVWIDGSIAITGPDLYDSVRSGIAEGALYCGVPHPFRDCIYSEAWKVWRNGWISLGCMLRVWLFLALHGYPRHAGLTENGLMLRRHGSREVEELDNLCWDKVSGMCRRDQLSFMWCLRRSGLPFVTLLPDSQTIRNCPGLDFGKHICEK